MKAYVTPDARRLVFSTRDVLTVSSDADTESSKAPGLEIEEEGNSDAEIDFGGFGV